MTGSERARVMPWDGRPSGKCDWIGCPNVPVLHVELTSPGSEYGAESDLCADHSSEIANQAHAFLIALGRLAPITTADHNVAAVMAEHIEEES